MVCSPARTGDCQAHACSTLGVIKRRKSKDSLYLFLLSRSHVIASVFREKRGIILTSESRRKDSVAEEQLPMRGPL